MLKLLYLVPNVADPAVARRVSMLQAGGASVAVAGFIRHGAKPPRLNATSVTILGETADGQFAQRILAVLRGLWGLKSVAVRLGKPDVIMARNLEMLPIANRLRAMWGRTPTIVYECLDIHRLMLRQDPIGTAMRWAEQRLTRHAALLVTSSPGFLRNYFDVYGAPQSLLVENKVPFEGGVRGHNPALAAGEKPIRIGWFGALRCKRSLAALTRFADSMDGKVEIVLRGQPALREFDDFHGTVAQQAHLEYAGPYKNPDDLQAIYSDVHFAWAIDFFEAGQNSAWLLPNRLYEGCLHGAIPIALQGTETAYFLERHGLGIVLPDIEQASLIEAIAKIDPAQLQVLAQAVAKAEPKLFAFDTNAARQLVAELAFAGASHSPLEEVA